MGCIVLSIRSSGFFPSIIYCYTGNYFAYLTTARKRRYLSFVNTVWKKYMRHTVNQVCTYFVLLIGIDAGSGLCSERWRMGLYFR